MIFNRSGREVCRCNYESDRDAILHIARAHDALVRALEQAEQGVQAFLDMVNIMQKFQALPIPAVLELAQHNCPIMLADARAALALAKGGAK